MSDPRNVNEAQLDRDNDPGRSIDPADQDRANRGWRTGAGQPAGNPRKDQPMQGDPGRREERAGDKHPKEDKAAGKKNADRSPDKSDKRPAKKDDDSEDSYSHHRYK